MNSTRTTGITLEAGGPPAELVRLAQVSRHFGKGATRVQALHEIDLVVLAGEMVVICGPSGNGKTTLLNLVSMLDSASAGSVSVVRLLVAKLSEQARTELRGELMGMIFQCYELVPVLSALDNVLLPLSLRGHADATAQDEARAWALELLGQLGLANQAHQLPPRLDAGQRQRVGIARALVTRPRLVLADEPTTRLDNGAIRQVMDLFARQQRQHGTAFIITTRDQRQLSRSTRTLQLNEGRLLAGSALAPRPLRVLR